MKNFKISHNFSRKDFSCKCGKCQSEFRMSLTIVGIVEHLKGKFKKRVNIMQGYLCEEQSKELFGNNKDYHKFGKAVDVQIEDVPLQDIFKEVESMPEVTGIGFCPADNHIHIDIRDKDREVFLIERGEKTTMSDRLRRQYDLL